MSSITRVITNGMMMLNKMEIKKTITLNVDVHKKTITCYDTTTLQLVLGTKGACGNYHMYQITKKGNRFIIPMETIKNRIRMLEERKARIDDSLEVMKQVVK